MAENYAMKSGYLLEVYPAEWGKHGRAAGPKRNEEMVEKSNAVIAFWNGKPYSHCKKEGDYSVCKKRVSIKAAIFGLRLKNRL